MSRRMVMVIEGEDGSAEVELLEDEAPETCALIWDSLPISGTGMQARFMGDVVFMELPDTVRMEQAEKAENCIAVLQPGEVYYYFTPGGKYHGWCPEPTCELGWAYGRFNRLTTPLEPQLGNLFGRMVGDPTGFLEASRRLHSGGFKKVTIRRAEQPT